MSEEPMTLYKLIILYMLQKVDFPLTNAQISSFLLDREYTTYFTFQSALSELLESQMISVESVHSCSYYSITEEGTEALTYFHSRISPEILAEIDQYLTENKMQMRDEVSVLADYYKNTGGDFSVHVLVREKFSNPIELTVTVPDEEEAKKACARWKECSQQIYEYVMQELLGGKNK